MSITSTSGFVSETPSGTSNSDRAHQRIDALETWKHAISDVVGSVLERLDALEAVAPREAKLSNDEAATFGARIWSLEMRCTTPSWRKRVDISLDSTKARIEKLEGLILDDPDADTATRGPEWTSPDVVAGITADDVTNAHPTYADPPVEPPSMHARYVALEALVRKLAELAGYETWISPNLVALATEARRLTDGGD